MSNDIPDSLFRRLRRRAFQTLQLFAVRDALRQFIEIKLERGNLAAQHCSHAWRDALIRPKRQPQIVITFHAKQRKQKILRCNLVSLRPLRTTRLAKLEHQTSFRSGLRPFPRGSPALIELRWPTAKVSPQTSPRFFDKRLAWPTGKRFVFSHQFDFILFGSETGLSAPNDEFDGQFLELRSGLNSSQFS